jgi:hypothetical protein
LWEFDGNLEKIQGKSRKNLSKWVIQQSRSNIYRCYTCYSVTGVTGVTGAHRNCKANGLHP